MAYLALARKWRPQQFEEVVGQTHVTRTLVNAIDLDRLSHAYLFTGPRGIGKTTIARIFAKSLNCLSSETATARPCDRCDSCREIAEGNSLDVLEIDGASNTSVDDVRELRENVKYAPSRSRYKIYIIDEVHMLSGSAFNALLKTLEEPPSHVKFFFATTEPQKLPATIISRCQRFDLRKIPREQIEERLKKILQEEKVEFEEEALRAVIACSDGSMRDAESILDQLLVYCESKISRKDVSGLLGLVPEETLDEFSRAICEGDVPGVIELAEEVINQGWPVPKFLAALVEHFRNLLIIEVSKKGKELAGLSDEGYEKMKGRARQLTHPQLLYILDELIRAEREIKFALSERIALEVALIRLARSPRRVYLEDLIGDLKALAESREGNSSPSPSRNPAPENTGSTEDSSQNWQQVKDIWVDFIETLGKNRPILKTYLNEGTPTALENGVLMVSFGEEFDFNREHLESPPHLAYLENLLKNKLGFSVKMKFVVNPGRIPGPDKTPAQKVDSGKAKKKLIKQNPLVEKAIELFDGTIINIKE